MQERRATVADEPEAPLHRWVGSVASTPQAETVGSQALDAFWPAGLRIAFRFIFVYLIIFVFPFPIGALPFTDVPSEWMAKGQRRLVSWFGQDVLHLKGPTEWHPTGSGDTLHDWIAVLLTAILATIAATIWSLVTARRERRKLHELLRVYVRYGLGSIILMYGLSKIVPSQFPANDPARLIEPYGSFSPMGVVWALMGASMPYSFVAGLGETVGATLLFFRRTTTVGALVLLAVMGNVVLLNFCYDVPVKIGSSHFWLMALFLAGPDLGLMYAALVQRRTVAPAAVDWRPAKRTWRIAALGGKATLLGLLGFQGVYHVWSNYRQFANRTAGPIEGVWEVDEIIGEGPHWQRIGIGSWRAGVTSAEIPYEVFGVEYDQAQSRLTLHQAERHPSFGVQFTDESHLVLEGPFVARLHHVDPAQLLLTSRGFHWVQEYPLNR